MSTCNCILKPGQFSNVERMERNQKDEPRTVVYYAHLYSSFQRGTNENCNGILRRFFPKRTNFDGIPNEKLQWVESRINCRS